VDKYRTLVAVLDDYIQHIEEINDKRSEYAMAEIKFIHQEVQIFDLLKRNLQIIKSKKGSHGVSKD
jgi:hypothetical protein